MADARLGILITADVASAVTNLQKIPTAAEQAMTKAASSVKLLEAELVNLSKLKASPNVSADQISSAINSVKAKIAELKSPTLTLDASQIESSVKGVFDKINSLKSASIKVELTGIESSISEITSRIKSADLSLDISANTNKVLSDVKLLGNEISKIESISIDGGQVNSTIEGIRAKIESIKAVVPVTVDGAKINASIDQLLSRLTSIPSFKFDADISAIDAALNKVQSRLKDVDVLDTGKAIADIKVLENEFLRLQKLSINPKVDPSQLTTAIDLIKTRVEGLRASIPLNVDRTQIDSAIDQLTSRLSIIAPEIAIKTTGVESSISVVKLLENELKALQKLSVSPNISVEGLASVSASITKVKELIGEIKTSNVSLTVDGSQISTTLEQLKVKLESFKAQLSGSLPVEEFNRLSSTIAGLEAQISAVTGKKITPLSSDIASSFTDLSTTVASTSAQIDANIDKIIASASGLGSIKTNASGFFDLEKAVSDATTRINDKINSIVDNALKLSGFKTSIELNANGEEVLATIESLTAKLTELQAKAASGLSLDTSGLQASFDKIQAEFQSLVSSAKITGDTSALDAALKSIQAKIEGLSANVEIKGDTSLLESQITSIKNELTGVSSSIKLSLDDGVVKNQITDLKGQLETISSSAKIGADTTEFDAALKEIHAKIALVDDLSVDITANKVPLDAAIKEISADLASVKGSVITIGANSQPAITSIEQLESELSQLSIKLKNATNPKDFVTLSKGVSLVKEQIRNLSAAGLDKFALSANKATQSLGKLNPVANTSNFAILNLGRVLQDSSFGFIGIANNLNPLLESFQRLSAEAKLAGVSVRSSLVAALTGPAGIGVALSAITAILQFSQLGFSAWTRGFSSAGSAAGESAREIKSATDIIGSAFDNAQGDAAKVNALVSAFANTDSFDKQKRILSELKDINESYFGQLKAGVSTFTDITNAANGYTQALIQQAIVKGLQEEISELSKQMRVSEKEVRAASKAAEEAEDNYNKFGKSVKGVSESTVTTSQSTQQYKNTLGRANAELATATIRAGKLQDSFSELTNAIQAQVGISLKLKPLDKGGLNKTFKDATDDIIARARQFAKEFGDVFVVPELEESFFVNKDEILGRAKKLLSDIDLGNLKIKLPVQIITEADFFIEPTVVLTDELRQKYLDELKSAREVPFVFDPTIQLAINAEKAALDAKKQAEQLAESIKGIFANAFQSLGEDIGNVLTGGGDLFKSVFAIIGAGVAALGKQIIALGVAALSLKNALKFLLTNPALAIAAGVALTAIGTAMKNTTGVKGFSEGGLVFGPTLGLIGEGSGTSRSNPEVIAPLDKLRSMLKGVGGGAQVVLIRSRLRGRDNILQIERENRSQRR